MLFFITPVYGFASPLCKSLFETVSTDSSSQLNLNLVLQSIANSAQRLTKSVLGLDRETIKKELAQDPRFDWIADLILEDHLLFAMNRNEERRTEIVKEGF